MDASINNETLNGSLSSGISCTLNGFWLGIHVGNSFVYNECGVGLHCVISGSLILVNEEQK